MSDAFELLKAPELFFGLVAPIGVDLDLVTEALNQALLEVGYDTEIVRLTKLMREVGLDRAIRDEPYIESYRDRIEYANEVRSRLGDTALAELAISAIRASRVEHWTSELPPSELAEAQPEESPVPNRAYVIRQFKRPEEIRLMRRVYGRQFVLISAYAPKKARRERIRDRHRRSMAGLIEDTELDSVTDRLVRQDENEAKVQHGQSVQTTFPLGDVFIDASSRASCENSMRRFIRLLFGHNHITPTRDEYGMYIAKSASLRSSDLSRQVGAAIFRRTGEIAAMGCNEVPKAGGGTYWPGDSRDARDFVRGFDPNEHQKLEILVDLLDRLRAGGYLSQVLMGLGSAEAIGNKLLAESPAVQDSKLMDIIEFGRIIHAEMSAICDAGSERSVGRGRHSVLDRLSLPSLRQAYCRRGATASGLP